ncbi:MAG TPA: DinB family protein [Gemmatimonadales bacterium]|nr:DinB family protein [Gemmatimonadales bacterium]
MHPRLAELVDYVTAQRTTLLVAVSTVPEALRDARIDTGVWSIAEVLEHLHRVESGIARLIARTMERGRRVGIPEEQETGSLLDSLDAYDLTRRDRRLVAPDPVAPRGGYTAAQGLAALAQSREALLAAVRSGDGLALGGLTFPHPLLGSLDMYQWILFVGQHEARHAAQIAELGRTPTGPGPGTRSP